jgi:hypothetical protein
MNNSTSIFFIFLPCNPLVLKIAHRCKNRSTYPDCTASYFNKFLYYLIKLIKPGFWTVMLKVNVFGATFIISNFNLSGKPLVRDVPWFFYNLINPLREKKPPDSKILLYKFLLSSTGHFCSVEYIIFPIPGLSIPTSLGSNIGSVLINWINNKN